MTIIFDESPQGTEGWIKARRGVCTASRFKDARNRPDGLTAQQRAYVNALKAGASTEIAMAAAGYKKAPTFELLPRILAGEDTRSWSAAALAYACDLAREREGGLAPGSWVNPRYTEPGKQEEPVARLHYEERTASFVEEVGFAYTEDRKFGCSADGLLAPKGGWECKTMVSSSVLFEVMVHGDISEYRDQCLGEMWLLGLDWVDLTLWCPDLMFMKVLRIEREEDEIEALERDMLAFDALVESLRLKLRAALEDMPEGDDLAAAPAAAPAASSAPAPAPAPKPVAPVATMAPSALPAELF